MASIFKKWHLNIVELIFQLQRYVQCCAAWSCRRKLQHRVCWCRIWRPDFSCSTEKIWDCAWKCFWHYLVEIKDTTETNIRESRSHFFIKHSSAQFFLLKKIWRIIYTVADSLDSYYQDGHFIEGSWRSEVVENNAPVISKTFPEEHLQTYMKFGFKSVIFPFSCRRGSLAT